MSRAARSGEPARVLPCRVRAESAARHGGTERGREGGPPEERGDVEQLRAADRARVPDDGLMPDRTLMPDGVRGPDRVRIADSARGPRFDRFLSGGTDWAGARGEGARPTVAALWGGRAGARLCHSRPAGSVIGGAAVADCCGTSSGLKQAGSVFAGSAGSGTDSGS